MVIAEWQLTPRSGHLRHRVAINSGQLRNARTQNWLYLRSAFCERSNALKASLATIFSATAFGALLVFVGLAIAQRSVRQRER